MVNSSGTTTYAWDFENRLTTVTLPGNGGTVYFKYDPFGRRIYKSSSSGTSIYAYDGDNLIEETNSAGAAVARYSQGLNIDEPLVMLRSGTTSYYQADGLGSLTSLSNTSGALANTYTYDSFGNLVASSASIVNNFRYTGREFDPETSLYYYRARYYDPAAGRLLREDPFGFQAGPNFYAYTLNQPSNFIDPLGLDIAVVENGPTPPSNGDLLGNPVGHTALCISGAGVFSFGNQTPLGSSCTDYLKKQASRRDTIVRIIHTTPVQDAAALAYLRNFGNSGLPKTSSPTGDVNDNCATRANNALDAAGIPMVDLAGNPMIFPWQVPAPRGLPGTAGNRAAAAGGTPYLIPQGNPGLPSSLSPFDPH